MRSKSRPRRSAILVTRDDRGRVLLVRQRGGPFKAAWLLPGGGLEPGESFDAAMRREVLEETGLDVISAHEIARYDVRAPDFRGEVLLYGGTVSGALRSGHDEEPAEWADVDQSTAHPVLLRTLKDAGLIDTPEDRISARAAELGIAMRRI